MKINYIPDCVFDGQCIRRETSVCVENDKIIAMNNVAGAKDVSLQGMLVPGFIDVQVNGGGGVLFNHDPSVAGLAKMAATHGQFGTTGLLPTLITDSVSVMERAADAVSAALKQNIPGILGIHFEGPHLSKSKKGMHGESQIRPISAAEMKIFCRRDIGIRVVTVAPEMVSEEKIFQLVNNGVHVCLGHSNAEYATVLKAIAAGARGFTHLFNAMSLLQGREPGMIGAALNDKNTWCGLIMDGVHVDPVAAKVALAAKQCGKMILVTDAMSLVGTDQQSYTFYGETIKRTGNKLSTTSGALAGSVLDMATAVRNCVYLLDVSIEEALRMASLYPSEFLGISDQYGSLVEGKAASFILLDDELCVTNIWINGQQVFNNP